MENILSTYFVLLERSLQGVNDAVFLLSEINQKLDNLSGQGVGFSAQYGDALFGFLGVIIGAVITFAFNEVGRKNDAKSRFAVQRKNLIYAPLYKEMLRLSQYMQENNQFCYINILDEEYESSWREEYYFNGKRRSSGRFMIWNKIKNDIRRDYVPPKLRECFDRVGLCIKRYNEEKGFIEKQYRDLWNGRVNVDDAKTRYGLGEIPVAFFRREGEYTFDSSEIKSKFSDEDANKRVESLFRELPILIKRDIIFSRYEELISSIKEAESELDKLVQYIINKYEYGDELNKYD